MEEKMLLLSMFMSSARSESNWWTREMSPAITSGTEEDGSVLIPPPCKVCSLGTVPSSTKGGQWQTSATSNLDTLTGSTTGTRVPSSLPEYNLSEVSNHCSPDDCWLVIFDRVYNVTSFLQEHPGGEYIMMEFAGRDATIPFRSTRHGKDSYQMLSNYLIGILPENERIYQDFSLENESWSQLINYPVNWFIYQLS